jgi:hypothetical protein
MDRKRLGTGARSAAALALEPRPHWLQEQDLAELVPSLSFSSAFYECGSALSSFDDGEGGRVWLSRRITIILHHPMLTK